MSIPFENLRVFRRKGVIKPVFIRKPLGILTTLIKVFKDHLNKKRWQLNEVLSDCENLGYNFRMVRGIVSVLETRSLFESRFKINPLEVRRQVFTNAASTTVTNSNERLKILKIIADQNKITLEELEDSLYADLYDEQYLTDFREPSNVELMKYYNYAIVVTLLAYSQRIELSYRNQDKYLENLINRIGSSNISGSNVTRALIELKPSRQLRNRADRINEIMSRVIDKPDWSLQANINYPTQNQTSYLFKIDKNGDGKLIAVDQHKTEFILEIS